MYPSEGNVGEEPVASASAPLSFILLNLVPHVIELEMYISDRVVGKLGYQCHRTFVTNVTVGEINQSLAP